MKRWYVYMTMPVDFGWALQRSVAEVVGAMTARNLSSLSYREEVTPDSVSVDGFLVLWESAQGAAREAGWEEDFMNEPVVFCLPDGEGNEFTPGFVFKQSNNGTTWVVSPVKLPHLGPTAEPRRRS